MEENISVLHAPITVTTNAGPAAGTTSINNSAASYLTWPSKMVSRDHRSFSPASTAAAGGKPNYNLRTVASAATASAAAAVVPPPPPPQATAAATGGGAAFQEDYDAEGAGRMEGSKFDVDTTIASRADTWLAISARDAWLP